MSASSGAYDQGSALWPGIALDRALFEQWLERRPETARPASAAELYLACACGQREPRALAAFEGRYGAMIAGVLRRFGDAARAADLKQEVLHRLFVDEPPRILEYSGRGGLGSFARVVAVRTALNLIRREKVDELVDDSAILESPMEPVDPEIEQLKRQYRPELKVAFQAAMASIPDRARNVLRLYYLDGLSLAELGGIYRWSVPTASRRIAEARAAVLDATRRELGLRLRITATEIDSVLRLLQSGLGLSDF